MAAHPVNETTEMWREHRQEMQRRRASRREANTAEIIALRRRGYEVVELTEFQFRINGTLDLFPTRRFHNIATGDRGAYKSAQKIADAVSGRGRR